jgi:hypothetical protein
MNHADDAFAFNRTEIWAHRIVMRKIHDLGSGESTGRKRKKQNRSPENRRLHHNPKSKQTYRAGLAYWQEDV